MAELPKTYEPETFEGRIAQRWLDTEAFAAVPDARTRDERYVIMMPLPNVTGALHMGHAMDNVCQDLLIRWHRMQGKNTLWQPGTDHAGIATQAVVEKRLKEQEGKTRHDIGREALVERIWAWKDEYQARIVCQQREMGCSADWERQRFTRDEVCSAAVRESFFRLFRDRLIFRGPRLVNWDCHLQTAVANDELYHETVQGHFWHLRYPIENPGEGNPDHVVVATTRPETMLGDTAVATHPDPAKVLGRLIEKAQAKLAEASDKDRADAQAELDRLEARRESHLPGLLKLVAMAKAGATIRLPLMDREIPLILDEWAKPELGSGCVKITPAHDPNDYQVWQRHLEIGAINILSDDGTLNAHAGPYQGDDMFTARDRVVADLDALGFLAEVEDREIEIGFSDRSKTAIQPYLSQQWFVRMEDVPGGVTCGQGTDKEFKTPGLAQAAIDAAAGEWTSASGLKVDFHPDSERYRGTYIAWLAEKRDWCISRQLWWGHRIAVWWKSYPAGEREALAAAAAGLPSDPEQLQAWISDNDGTQHSIEEGLELAANQPDLGPFELQICLRGDAADEAHAKALEALGLERDPDVLDTWFSSALWPFSTLGWPDPPRAKILEGQRPLGASADAESSLDFYYPGSCLVTGRDILTLWVARMVILGLYNLGDLPFTDVFLHAKILDGKGVTMSKSRGNGVDPVDICNRYGTDAMRYVICDMQTGMQDVRLPVQATCPGCQGEVELSKAKRGRTKDGSPNLFSYLCTDKKCGVEFGVVEGPLTEGLVIAPIYSDRFEEGKKFCNKLWNTARFAFMNLGEELSFQPLSAEDLLSEDRWILSRLSKTIRTVGGHLEAYNPSAAIGTARDFCWNELCDWYLELIKPRMKDETQAPVARQVLATVLDQVLRLLHPFVPFVTEVIWEQLNGLAPERGIEAALPASEGCIKAAFPVPHPGWEGDALEAEFTRLQEVIRKLRDVRSKYNVPPKKALPGAIEASGDALASFERLGRHVSNLVNLSSLEVAESLTAPENSATSVGGGAKLYLGDVLDPAKERVRLGKERERLSKAVTGIEKKLGNERFVAKAPPEVVEAERKRLIDYKGQLVAVEEGLAGLA
ncbi:MAG: valine--tRNA ligase [Planctomycetes bacterium]|nr:valine--tRNA ligase [Planctomycetota bacterium]